MHDRQHYELINYRRADAELNYRRFFAVSTLAGIRVELPEVFAASHAEIARWVEQRLGRRAARSTTPTGWPTRRGYLRRPAPR